ncbi:MAG: helix-turn-helix transcriptional regulator [Oscillospiraceae bacterium]|nr:helix-turn-helix transcriptional regulator [Oscillospiraceae bacterium]
MEDWRINFCQNLRHLRQVYGLTQREMAGIVGVSLGTYGKMERCDPRVRIHSGRVCRICDHFNVRTDDMLYQNWPQMLETKS